MEAALALANTGVGDDALPLARVRISDLRIVDLADLLLLAVVRRQVQEVSVEPVSGGQVHIVARQGAARVLVAELPSARGVLLMERLALVAEADLAQAGAMKKFRVLAGDRHHELLLAARDLAAGLALDVSRLDDGAEDAASGVGAGLTSRIGAYRLLEELGRGGMGVVYRGVHVAIGKPVAVKVLSETLAQTPLSIDRILHEARIASRLRHPGLVDVFDFGILPDGRPFLVMELVQAPTLEQVIAGGPLSVERALRLGIRVADALAAAHAAGIVHRDLKPANVFVLPGDLVKIGDFGAAKVVPRHREASETAEQTRSDYVIGTPQYMPPEQAKGYPADQRSDLYAVGCLMFEMLTGRPLFESQKPREALLRHVREPVPAFAVPEPLPPGLEACVRKALAKRPGDRQRDVAELASELRACASAARGRIFKWWVR